MAAPATSPSMALARWCPPGPIPTAAAPSSTPASRHQRRRQRGGAGPRSTSTAVSWRRPAAALTSLGNHVINSASFTGGFNIAAGNSFTVSQAIGGTGSLSKLGAGKLTLSGTNAFSGLTTVNAGTLTLANTLALQQSTSTAAPAARPG